MLLRSVTTPFAWLATRARKPTKLVAIVIPISSRPTLRPDEEISLRQLKKHLGSYDTFLIASPDSPIRIPGIARKEFPRRFFGSVSAHNWLLFSPSLYRAFSEYRYILFYHLDSLVLSDQLEQWCAAGVDYIGPPWISCEDSPWVTRPRVGNGGFTLLNVRAALDVLYRRYRTSPLFFWIDHVFHNGPGPRRFMQTLQRLRQRFPRSKLITRPLHEWEAMENPSATCRHNDLFWSDEAVKYLPSFKVASLAQGLQFAFEASPRTCLQMNGGRLPFGCHAWARYDHEFWERVMAERSPLQPA